MHFKWTWVWHSCDIPWNLIERPPKIQEKAVLNEDWSLTRDTVSSRVYGILPVSSDMWTGVCRIWSFTRSRWSYGESHKGFYCIDKWDIKSQVHLSIKDSHSWVGMCIAIDWLIDWLITEQPVVPTYCSRRCRLIVSLAGVLIYSVTRSISKNNISRAKDIFHISCVWCNTVK